MSFQYEANCVCGASWRVYRETCEEDQSADCIACGERHSICVSKATTMPLGE